MGLPAPVVEQSPYLGPPAPAVLAPATQVELNVSGGLSDNIDYDINHGEHPFTDFLDEQSGASTNILESGCQQFNVVDDALALDAGELNPAVQPPKLVEAKREIKREPIAVHVPGLVGAEAFRMPDSDGEEEEWVERMEKTTGIKSKKRKYDCGVQLF